MTRRTTLVLAGILLIQSVVVARVYTPQPHSGGDNAGYVTLAHSLLDRGAYLELWDVEEPSHTKYPPLLAVLLAGAILLGAKSWSALKLVPAFSVVLAVAFTFLWARSRRGLTFAVVVALLCGLSESVVYYSQWILSDPTFLALTMGALWALQKSSTVGGRSGEVDSSTGGEGSQSDEEEVREEIDRWLILGMVMVTLAYFTRSAGLPLAGSTFVWLAFKKRWKALATFGLVFALPAFLWWLRGSLLGGGEYVSEFWLVDPYQPHLGTVGLVGLWERVVGNGFAYITTIIPAGVVGDGRPFMPPLGIGFGLIALVGWLRMVRKRVSVVELFLPLYLGLILLWPPAWSGDRFALPLLPVLFFYAGSALLWLLSSFPTGIRRGILAGFVLTLAVPAALEWNRMGAEAASCREATHAGNAGGCLFPAQGEYFALAEWSGKRLPEGAVVTTRKPRFFYVMSGVKAQAIPLVADRDEFLNQVREGRSRYVSLDYLDAVSGYYVYPVLLERLASFCGLVEVGEERARTQMLGILQGETRGEIAEEEAPILPRCPGEMMRPDPMDRGPVGDWGIPLLIWSSAPRS